MARHRTLLAVPLFGFAVAAVVGCGGGGNPLAPASVSGSVSYKGKTVTGGSISFVTPTGTPYSSAISVDGTYAVADLPTGEMIVVVETESVNPEVKAASGKDADRRNAMMGARTGPNGQSGGGGSSGLEAKYIKIPEKYSKSKTSPLTYMVKNGRQVHPVELE